MENLPSLDNKFEFKFPIDKLTRKYFYYTIVIVIFLLFIYYLFFSVPRDFPENSIINIKEGTSLRAISRNLEGKNIIRSRVLFETFVIIFGGEKRLAYGDYLLDKKLSVFEVARRLSYGERHLAPVKVTIPEGFNILDISKAYVVKLPNFNEEKFKEEAKEGYLFPDTYFFLTTDSEQDVISAMSNNFEKKMKSIRPKIISSGKIEKDIIVMASLIEEESKGDIDRKIISGILWKRLDIGMPLQVDADMSTYKTKGLPQNPISNPGLKSIEAAIFPERSPYLYYLHDSDGNVHYARTFEQHKLNKAKYLK